VRLAQRGRLERAARGVYRIPYIPLNRFSQYREAVLWAKAHRGPMNVALSHETALVAYGISYANPAAIHMKVPSAADLEGRRRRRFGFIAPTSRLTKSLLWKDFP
jgi:predicted transcriptional regulator of viral defense system